MRACVRAHDDERTKVGHFTVFHVALSRLTDRLTELEVS